MDVEKTFLARSGKTRQDIFSQVIKNFLTILGLLRTAIDQITRLQVLDLVLEPSPGRIEREEEDEYE